MFYLVVEINGVPVQEQYDNIIDATAALTSARNPLQLFKRHNDTIVELWQKQ